MPIYVDYTQAQNEIISEIQKQGLYEGTKTRLLVLMSTNNYIRTVDDLAGILCEYPGMPNQEELAICISSCIQEGLLKKCVILNILFCQQDAQCLQKFLDTLPEKIQVRIRNCRASYQESECVRVLGLLSGGSMGGYINASFLQRLKDARTEILLPMLNTSPNRDVIEILKERATAGIKIKILLPDYKNVVTKIRRGKEDVTYGWIEPLNNIDNIEIRIYTHVEDASIYSSVIIDKSICRFCVFDYVREKSSNGTLIEISKNGYDLNLINIIIDCFNGIWMRSRPVYENKFFHLIKDKKVWLFIALLVCLKVYFMTENTIQAIILNIMMAFSGMLITAMYKPITSFLSGLYKKIMK